MQKQEFGLRFLGYLSLMQLQLIKSEAAWLGGPWNPTPGTPDIKGGCVSMTYSFLIRSGISIVIHTPGHNVHSTGIATVSTRAIIVVVSLRILFSHEHPPQHCTPGCAPHTFGKEPCSTFKTTPVKLCRFVVRLVLFKLNTYTWTSTVPCC